MARRSWTKHLPAKTVAAARKAARAAARPYARGEKLEPAHSPTSRRLYGTHLPAKKAAEMHYRKSLRESGTALAGRKGLAYGDREAQVNRKLDPTARKGRTSTGGRWTLRKANVRRAKDGTFRSRG